jgi:ketosteroid isomerase-like protein
MRSLKIVFVSTAVILLCLTPTFANPQKDAVAQFYELRERTLDQRGSASDVDKLLRLLTDDVKYEHPLASVVMTNAEVRTGMLAHLREGEDAKFTLHNARFADGFAVVEYSLAYTVKGSPINRSGVSIFEFRGDRISRVAEY